MGALVVVEDAYFVASDLVAFLFLIGMVTLVVVLVRRIRRDRRVDVDEQIAVSASAEEVSTRIAAALVKTAKADVTQPGPWHYVIAVKHISGLTAALGGVILASIARNRLVLQVALFQETQSVIVVRIWGVTELSVVEALRNQLRRPV